MTHAATFVRSKQNDIQWLRALAIVAILGFHIWPNVFPFGYLGVDIFFVISGYLMTSILEKAPSKNLFTFYLRRIKRIFPTCLSVITVVIVFGYVFLLKSDYEFLQMEALWLIFFVNNLSTMLNQQQYFELVSEYKFLLHTWSLGVEIQFYLIAPFLIKFILSKQNPIKYLIFIQLASILLQALLPNKSMAFGLVVCRIWQFLSGTFAFCIIQKYRNQQNFIEKSYLTKIVILTLIFTALIPKNLFITKIPQLLLQLSVTILTSLLIMLNNFQPISLPNIINQILVYVGDTSYVIYLFHWPLIIYFRYFSISNYYGTLLISTKFKEVNTLLGTSFTIICIILPSIVIHETFEKQMSKKSTSFNLCFTAICYFLVLYLCLFTTKLNNHITDIVKLNEEEAKTCSSFQLPFCKTDTIIERYLTNRPSQNKLDVYCSYSLDSKSNKPIMITGNSFVYFQAPAIAEALKQTRIKYSKVYIVAHPGCSLLIGEFNKLVTIRNCENFDGSHDELLNNVQPDVIIHTARYDFIKGFNEHVQGDIRNDKIYNAILKSVLHLSKFTKKLIILQPTPHVYKGYKNPLSIAHLLMKNESLDKYDTPIELYKNNIYPTWNRIQEAAKLCSNCVLMEVESLFCSNLSCPIVDSTTKLGQYCDVSHTSPGASMKIIPHLIKAIDNPVP